MRERDASVESRGVDPSRSFPLPDAEFVTAAWFELPPTGGCPLHPDKAKRVSRAAVVLGAVLLLFVPLGGALLVVAGSLGLVISSEPTD